MSQGPVPDPWNRLTADDLRLLHFADMKAKPISSTKGRQEEWLSEEFQQIHESRKNRLHQLEDS
jgi:hypothetical protein